jgi:PAS domain S-box-containing protein
MMIVLREFLLKNIVESGAFGMSNDQSKKTIILSNHLALILIFASILLLIIIPGNWNYGGVRETFLAILIFFVPILLNRFRWYNTTRLYLCWCPLVLITSFMILRMQEASVIPVSTYDGLRFYILALSCIPYLLLEKSNTPVFIAGIVPGFVGIVFCDNIFDLAGVGIAMKGEMDGGYQLTPVRSFVSFVFISGSCFALKILIDRSDRQNEKLRKALEEKNELIREQAIGEVKQLNDQLKISLQQLEERERNLNHSQRIAKVGSWEYNVEADSIFWSDEMYNIFGLDQNFNLKAQDLSEIMWRDQNEILVNSTRELLHSGQPFDVTVQIQTPLGYWKWLRVQATPIMSSSQVIGVNGVCHDITFYKEAEELLRKSEHNYRSLFAQASDAIIVTDLEGKIVDVNATACDMLGYTRDEILNCNITKTVHPESLNANPIPFERLSRGEEVFDERRMIRKNGHEIEVEAHVKMFTEGQLMAIVRDITARKRIEIEKEKARYLLNERVKELTTLYQVSQLLNDERLSRAEALNRVVNILPAGWQYPEITAARICVEDTEYATANFSEGFHRQQAEISDGSNSLGTIEVVYLEKKGSHAFAEEPFMVDERSLINMVAEMVRVYLVRKREEEALSKAQANLMATINNTAIMIWSVDRDFRLLTFNKPFHNYAKETYNLELKLGERILQYSNIPERDQLTKKWSQYYMRALAGEIVSIEETRHGKDLHYSLSPIIERNHIIGVSVFAENVTELRKHDRALADATRKLSEMRLMALRSVMSPHFIFNALNSIQYFIAKNDRLNAINYLSTFSKLIRSVLSHSVANAIKLSDEIEMLKNYVQMEMMRFENKFDFILEIDPDVDPDEIEIPSLLIQPYVENAIIHGLYNKQDKGTLWIRVIEADQKLTFEIEDNGIGREEAMKLKEMSFPTHKSMGIKLTEERLKLINQHRNTAFEIDDIKNETGNGTRVRIMISY